MTLEKPTAQTTEPFFGWRVMWAAFAVAIFGWGIGFYGPPVFLHAVLTAHGWPIGIVSAAVTAHFLCGAFAVANMPAIYGRFGLATTTKFCGLCAAIGIVGWAAAQAPWHLFVASLFSGFGWAGTGGLAINMMVSPWFNRRRPAALSTAYNGASIGGVVFSPLWIALIVWMGFVPAALMVGGAVIVVLWVLSDRYFRYTPDDLGTWPDGDAPSADASSAPREFPALSGRALWKNRAFITYAGGFSIGLFAQVGLIAHMVSMLVPAFGAFGAGLAAGFATACAIAGRLVVGWFMPANADRRRVAAAVYVVQALGCGAFILAGGLSTPLLLLGVVLFGLGIGNVTSLPPLIAQAEFARTDVPRVVALGTAISQAIFAFAPAIFGVVRDIGESGGADAPVFFLIAAGVQMAAAWVYLAGRRTTQP